jgi:hypothetical protein
MTTPFRSLAISSDMTFEEIMRLIDERVFISHDGSPQGVYASNLVGVYAYDRINKALYFCTEADGTVVGTTWEQFPLVATSDDVDHAFDDPGSSNARFVTAYLFRQYLDQKSTGSRSFLRNSRFTRWTRGTSVIPIANSDLKYGPDCWYVTRDSRVAGYTISKNPTPPVGYPSCLRVTRATADSSDASFYIEQAIDPVDVLDMRGSTVNLSFLARKSAAWTGTRNTVRARLIISSDSTVVGLYTFSPSAFATTSPSEAMDIEFVMDNEYELFQVSGLVPSSTTQMSLVLSWDVSGEGNANDFLDIPYIKLSRGNSPTPFLDRDLTFEQNICSRFVKKSFPYSTAPGNQRGTVGAYSVFTNATGNVDKTVSLGNGMRDASYKIIFYNPVTATSTARNVTDNTDVTLYNTEESEYGFRLYGNATSSKANHSLRFHWLADGEYYGARQIVL